MATSKRFIAKNGLDNNSQTILNVADPVNATDAANRQWVLSNAGGATITDDTSTNATYYPSLALATSGSLSSVKTSSTKLSFNPSTGLLSSVGASLSGNLAFTGTGNRITGDFSNATLNNRILFQTSSSNSNTLIRAIPNGTGTQSAFQVGNNTDAGNQSIGTLSATSSEVQITADKNGTGSYLPLTFYTGGAGSSRMLIDTSGNVGIGKTPGALEKLGISTAVSSWAVAGSTNANNSTGIWFDASGNGQFAVRDTSGNLGIMSEVSGVLTFTNNSSERARIDASGNLTVGGTSAPSGRITVQGYTSASTGSDLSLERTSSATGIGNGPNIRFQDGTTNNTCIIQAGSGNLQFWNYGGGSWAERLRIGTSGEIGLSGANYGTSGQVLTSNGTGAAPTWQSASGGGATLSAAAASTYYIPMSATTTGTWTDARVDSADLYYDGANSTLYCTNFNTASDENLKENVETITDAVSTIDKLRGVSFNWKSNGKKSYGVIAQELEQILPDLVDTTENGKSVNYLGLIGFLLEAIKELSAKIEK